MTAHVMCHVTTGNTSITNQELSPAEKAIDEARMQTQLAAISTVAQPPPGRCWPEAAPCICSAHCCRGLACGFPIRQYNAGSMPHSASGNNSLTAGSAGSNASARSRATSTNSNTRDPAAGAAATTGGPSCRTLQDLDRITGVVNYAC
jgi:hypothetical protein